ncbi:hypothetical protein JCGZ_15313 [Jatropha curcas]|uniref:Uncharacterized protein n=1 Tax=Jatropha curcas TaxID=180498 RepID=A0A067LN41_JATCU|nr:protein starmaker [Jatropha curcas]KDP45869.1 hypothetical protein JCGZ_15313 [Jatropha curcas]
MGKSSSSKKKRSKYPSRGRTKKRSKTKSRSKKLRRRSYSVGYSSDNSRSSLSVSSSSEDNNRSRRSRSHTHKDVKGTKRRACSPSSSSEESHRVRKQKGSRRNDDYEVRKKSLRKKRRKKALKDASISPRSSGSLSCSTCWSSSSSSDESEHEGHRGRSQRRDNNVRKMKNVKVGTKKRRYRSRSCSSCSRQNGSRDCRSEEKISNGNISKRLKSIITLKEEDKETTELDRDEHKEEMIYDHDDYPSSRSNDSNEGGNKNVSAHRSHVSFDKERSIEIEKREDAFICDTKTTKASDSCKDRDEKYRRSETACDGVGTNCVIEEKNNEISEAAGDVNDDHLESILRQKALENLRRFRGGFQTNAKYAINDKDPNDGTLKSSSITRAELRQTESSKDDGAQGVNGNTAHSWQKSKKLLDGKNSGNGSFSAKNVDQLPNQIAVSDREKVNLTLVSGINKPRLVTSALKQALSNSAATQMELPASHVSVKAKLVTENSVDEHKAISLSSDSNGEKLNNTSGSVSTDFSSRASAGGNGSMDGLDDEGKEGSNFEKDTPRTVCSMAPLISNTDGDIATDASASTCSVPSSRLTSVGRDLSLNKEHDDGKESSQLEQKTMSVMRGGEIVQVSYKVYIPKKAPALARRQLKR